MDNQQQVFPQCKKYNDYIWVDTHGNTYNSIRKDSGLSSDVGEYKRLTIDKFVHRVVYETFIGNIPKNFVINHINGNKRDNRLENLEAITSSENRLHSIEVLNNNRYGGCILNKKKLTYSQVVEIGSYLKNTWVSIPELAQKYNVTTTAIGYINSGRNYKWLTENLFNDYPLRSRDEAISKSGKSDKSD